MPVMYMRRNGGWQARAPPVRCLVQSDPCSRETDPGPRAESGHHQECCEISGETHEAASRRPIPELPAQAAVQLKGGLAAELHQRDLPGSVTRLRRRNT